MRNTTMSSVWQAAGALKTMVLGGLHSIGLRRVQVVPPVATPVAPTLEAPVGSGQLDVQVVAPAELRNLPAARVLVVGKRGQVETPRGVLLGADDLVSFDRDDYADDASFIEALESIESLPYRAFAKRCPAQHHVLMEDKWRRMMDATAALREPASVRVVEERATKKRRESLWLEFTFNFGIRRRVFEIGDSNKGAAGARARAKHELRRNWVLVSSELLRATCEAFVAELQGVPSKDRSGLASVVQYHLEGATANTRQAATWRAGVSMDAVDEALHAFYDSLDSDALAFTSSVMDAPTWPAYVAFRDHKAACAQAVKMHAGLAAFHFPPQLIGRISRESSSASDADFQGAWRQFCADTLRLLSPTALVLLSAASQRYVLTALSRVYVSAFGGQSVDEEEVWEVASLFSSFMSDCAEHGGLPTYSVIRLVPLYRELFEYGRDGVRRAAAMARCIDSSELRAKDACFLYFRMLEKRPAFLDGVALQDGSCVPPDVDSIVRAYTETLRLIRMGRGPLQGGLSESEAERFSGRVAGRVTAATRALKSLLRPIDAQVLAVLGYSPEGGVWKVSELKLVGSRGRLQATFSLKQTEANAAARIEVVFGAGAAVGPSVVSGVFSYVSKFSATRPTKAKLPGKLEAQVNKVAAPGSRVSLLSSAVLARLETLLADQLRGVRQSNPWLFHCIFSTGPEQLSRDLDGLKRPSVRALDRLLKVALSSRDAFSQTEQSIVGRLVAMYPNPFGRNAHGLTLVEASMECASPGAIAHLMSCLRAHPSWSESPPAPGQVELLESALSSALARQSAEFLFALLGPLPEMSAHHMAAYEQWHPMFKTPEITASLNAALMTRTIRASRSSCVNDECYQTPPRRRRVEL